MGSELHGHLLQFVTELSPSVRKVIQLRHLEDMTTGEAAHILGLADGTVKAHVSRARTKLKQHNARSAIKRRELTQMSDVDGPSENRMR